MMEMLQNRPGLPVLCALLLTVGATVADVQVRENQGWDEAISLELKDAEIRQVLTLLFQIAEQPVVIDACVQGSVSLKFENATRREALASIVRMGQFRVRPKRDGYYIGCSAPEGLAADAHRLDFSLTQLGHGVVAQPAFLVAYDSLAEITAGAVDVPDLDDAGDFFSKSRQPTFRIKVYLRQASDDGELDQLRGLIEVATLEREAQPTLRVASRSFEVDFPEGTVDTLIGSIDLNGESYELRGSRLTR